MNGPQMKQNAAHVITAAQIVADKHNISTGQMVDILLRVCDMLDRGISTDEIIKRLHQPSGASE